MDRKSLEKYRELCRKEPGVNISVPVSDLNQIILMAEGFISLRREVVKGEEIK